MYSNQEARLIKQQFWTNLGQYLAPVPAASGNKINWINYKTGIRYINFKMDATDHAYIGIEISNKEKEFREIFFQHFKTLKQEVEQVLAEEWTWEENAYQEGRQISRIYLTLANVNVFNQADWPQIISFLKQRIILLDKFWAEQKEIFEMLG